MKRLDRLVQRWRIAKAVPFIGEGAWILDIGSGEGELFEVLGDRISFGIGVERIFPLHSPRVEKIDVIKRAKVRQARLYYLRELRGKATRLKELRPTRSQKNKKPKTKAKSKTKAKTKKSA